ncbi:ATP-binding protein [Fodinibius sp. SL11]|uniref:ATP-binding protein n=1 Tax=Fodinibius sp. SL11 TaxID=3425690 RepID=UPI003F88414F
MSIIFRNQQSLSLKEVIPSTVVGVKGDGLVRSYLPKLTVKTVRGNDRVIMQIEDNGSGIPPEFKEKTLQPFFTTKKGTEGTGVGFLSPMIL